MIFNSDTYGSSNGAISKYPVGLEGALMHVYENECNYNALMKAAGISELRYYQETGRDLFVHEAGAFSGFIEKAKAFFKKVIEKIKAIFHKFAAVLNQYTMKDKEFVKKYEKELYRKDLKDFEFNGYKFAKPNFFTNISLFEYDEAKSNSENSNDKKKSSEEIEDWADEFRGTLMETGSKLDESEFRQEFKDKFYNGDKESLDNIDIRSQLSIITNTKNDIKEAERNQKESVRAIEEVIKKLETLQKTYNKIDDRERNDENLSKYRTGVAARLGDYITLNEKGSNIITTYFGMVVQFYKDRNRQAKAICVKAIGYNKKESYSYSESSVNDLFAGVTIK